MTTILKKQKTKAKTVLICNNAMPQVATNVLR